MRLTYLLCAAAALLKFSLPASAEVITGNITNLPDSQLYVVTDGQNSAEFYWSEAAVSASGYVYAYINTDVAFATGITNVAQITNAAVFPLVTGFFDTVGPASDAEANGGIGQFVILKNSNTGYYAVVRFDDVQTNSTLNATWWFQTDGSADFSSFVTVGSLAAAVDAPTLPWTTGGVVGWEAETTTTFDGIDAVQSGGLSDDESSYIETTVTGPGTLTFRWRVSSEASFDFLSYYIDGNFQSSISGESGWLARTNAIGAGVHTVRWEYLKDSDFSAGADRGYLDQVRFITPAVTISNLALRLVNGDAKLSFTTQLGRTHVIEARTNATTGTWSSLTNVVGDGLLHTYTFPLGTFPQRFYRANTQ